MMVWLISDQLWFVLLALLGWYIGYCLCCPLLRAQWAKVTEHTWAMASLPIIFSMILVTSLDSIHWQQVHHAAHTQRYAYAYGVQSALDVVLAPRVWQFEKTYSAPFSTHSYQQWVTQKKGRFKKTYLPLHYAGTQLKRLQRTRFKDVFIRVTQACLASAMLFFIIFIVMALLCGRGHWRQGCQRLQQFYQHRGWRALMYSSMLLLFFLVMSIFLFNAYHIFGTDQVGHDVFIQAIKSIRTGVLIGTLSTIFMLPFALFLGVLAGYFGGWIDDLIQYVYITLSAIPGVLLISAVMLVIDIHFTVHQGQMTTLFVRSDQRLLYLCLVLGLTGWTRLCRLLRAETLKLRALDYIAAAKVLGQSSWGIIYRHLLPNMMHIVLITSILDFSGLVLAEAVLSYIGVGVDPTMASWGNMINSARLELARDPLVWWPLLAAFLFMFALVFAVNVLADAVRDAFDPHVVHD